MASGSIDEELRTRVLTVELLHDSELAKEVLRKKGELAQTGLIGPNAAEPHKSSISKGILPIGSSAHRNHPVPFRIWRVADMLLQPHPVVIPFAKVLAEHFPSTQERFMRDYEKVLILIKSSALLHQFQREKNKHGSIIAQREDYEIVYGLRNLLSESVSSTPEHIVTFLNRIKEASMKDGSMTKSEILAQLKTSNSSYKRYVKAAYSQGLIEVEGRGKNQMITVLEIPEVESPLPAPAVLFPEKREPVVQTRKTFKKTGEFVAHEQMDHNDPFVLQETNPQGKRPRSEVTDVIAQHHS